MKGGEEFFSFYFSQPKIIFLARSGPAPTPTGGLDFQSACDAGVAGVPSPDLLETKTRDL